MTELFAEIGRARLEIEIADITTLDVAAIVNAANSSLLGGCDTGDAKITHGYNLKAQAVIHAVGPVWMGGIAGEHALLASCYRTSLALAAQHSLPSLAFPAISTGIYRFPPDAAARIAVGTVASELAGLSRGAAPVLSRVIFCCFSAESAEHHKDAFGELGLV